MTVVLCRKFVTLESFAKGQATCFQAMNSVTCLASCQHFSKFTCPFGNLCEIFIINTDKSSEGSDSLAGTAFVQKVQVFHQQGEERNDDALALIGGSGRAPHGCLQGGPVRREVRRRVHLVLQDGEFAR